MHLHQRLTEDNIGTEICREHELDIQAYNTYHKVVNTVLGGLLISGVCLIATSSYLLFDSKNRPNAAPLLSLGIGCVWSIYREPFLFMRWKTRIIQCRQRTLRLRDLIELERYEKDDKKERKSWDAWMWRLKELMNVRAYFWSPYATIPPWSYDQIERTV